ncbi:MAG TPA: exonuclease domain-containing protein [Thermoanaerobaculia bacterium]|nr:exonuclease domain-containing protein [Thermoanaerobaculia bacterium]
MESSVDQVGSPSPLSFVALDFETANRSHASACAVAAVQVLSRKIVRTQKFVLDPGAVAFEFSAIHGITREHAAAGVRFDDAWREIEPLVQEAGFVIVAHNAKFDRRVLQVAAGRHGIRLPKLKFICSRNLAEAVWGLRPNDLATVAAHLGISLAHHDPLSDAEAAARIVLAAEDEKLGRLAKEVQG